MELGLSAAYRIVKVHNGVIRVQSWLGAGISLQVFSSLWRDTAGNGRKLTPKLQFSNWLVTGKHNLAADDYPAVSWTVVRFAKAF